MIPAPNLDDRTPADIVEEAMRLLPQYCPEWTNHNAADPGITLIELFAWMTEMVVYRLNKVADKNFLAFIAKRVKKRAKTENKKRKLEEDATQASKKKKKLK